MRNSSVERGLRQAPIHTTSGAPWGDLAWRVLCILSRRRSLDTRETTMLYTAREAGILLPDEPSRKFQQVTEVALTRIGAGFEGP